MKIKRVYLEITNACNLNCPFCSNEKGQSFMSLNDINKYLNDIKQICDYVYLHVLGEPLLHKDLDSILNICDELKLNVQLVTNGTLLYKSKFILHHPCIRKLSISLHSINNIDIANNYFNEINELIEINRNFNLELRFYSFDNLDTKLKEYYEYLKNKYYIIDTTKMNSYKLNSNTYIYFEKFFKWPNINDPIISNNGYCHGGIDQIAILNNGDVTLCCLDPKGCNKIGNIKETSLIDVLNSDKYNSYINNINKRNLTFDLCKKCEYRLRFDGKCS